MTVFQKKMNYFALKQGEYLNISSQGLGGTEKKEEAEIIA